MGMPAGNSESCNQDVVAGGRVDATPAVVGGGFMSPLNGADTLSHTAEAPPARSSYFGDLQPQGLREIMFKGGHRQTMVQLMSRQRMVSIIVQ